MAALSITVAKCEPGTWTLNQLNNMDLWKKVKVELQTQVGQPSRGQDAGSSVQNTCLALKVI